MSVHFHSLKIAEVVPETAEAVSLRFAIPPELQEAFAFKSGQHLTLRATLDGEEVRRNYSLCTAPDERDWKVTISEDWDGAYPTETDLVEAAIDALVEARRKLRREARRERWRLVAYRLVGRFSR